MAETFLMIRRSFMTLRWTRERDTDGKSVRLVVELIFLDYAICFQEAEVTAPTLRLICDVASKQWRTECVCDQGWGFPADTVTLVNLFSPSRPITPAEMSVYRSRLLREILSQPDVEMSCLV